MSMFAKIMVFVNLLLAVAFLAAAGTLVGSADNAKRKLETEVSGLKNSIATKDSQITTKDAELSTARSNVEAANVSRAASDAQLKSLQDSNATVNAENTRLKGEVEKLQVNVAELAKSVQDQTARNDKLMNENATISAEKADLANKNKTLEENLATETARADNAEKNTAAGEVKIKGLQENLDKTATELTAHIKKNGPLGNTVMKSVNGVVSASSAKDDVYVLSVGSKDGVELGYEFTVVRGGQYISTVVVDQVWPALCSARTKAGHKKSDVQSGDSVSTRL